MFKNRVRTAALAGAVAIATGLSGFSAPAFAQDTQQGGYQEADGSAAQNVTPENISEATLRELTDKTNDYLQALRNSPQYATIVEHYLNLGQDGFDPSEEAAAATFAEARDEAHAELTIASENIQKARASVAYALEKDQIATADWDKFVAAVNAYSADVNPLIREANAQNRTAKNPGEAPLIDELDAATRTNVVDVYNAIVALKAEVASQYKYVGIYTADRGTDDYVTRYHVPAVEALYNAVNGGYAAVEAALETALESNREAQKSDVLVRQLFLERATAQRDTLRVFKAWFSVVERYFGLYQNNILVGDTTLRDEYRQILGDIEAGVLLNLNYLAEADVSADEYLGWATDESDNDDADFLYFQKKREFALATYKKAFLDGDVWQSKLDRVELIDEALRADREAAAKAAADRERELKAAEELAAAQKAIADALAKDKVDGGQSTTKPSTSSFKLSS